MHLPVIKRYYNNLKPNSLEVDVDILWSNILPLYFDIRKDYGIEPQQRPYPGVVKTTDFVITAVRNGQPKKIVVIEDKRVSDEGSGAVWQEAVTQVTDYMKVARTSNFVTFRKTETVYAIVTVGRYSRFYKLRKNELQLVDFDNTGGKTYEFKKDEESIDGILLDIVQKTVH
ncbi:hypothetical protein BDP55DRAFT_675357 [Colletotrichum godetiae]|uniref:Uncharacterized protein n=1 Tax=Colletotrichum godetiae TaxID=1209918 RepID=A0AAJ0EQL4_9PEZI|nr:uncharacterized protein BDP55DRAFT_675357 [Colletotrichum godetiae]KAK1671767.1 hypothetical protein BDP55DRAFT_675357 [Colletotrichum godetiae]